ncbi:hypothetical protein [Streptomyces sp. MH60]|uniref:hypothetical protein n=1 Tax=Streptomyces sp. MH60 TaxID=1940758 RepID=UPI000CEEAF55|nr:hypothetical protein [Streptomyces sp. MH60]PPS86433.1 hypothetical protein BZZ08_03400 [Streptomyces sp. MH60]
MTLEEHARAVEGAIQAAAADGFYLDNGQGNGVRTLELNHVDDRGDPLKWETLSLPYNPMD